MIRVLYIDDEPDIREIAELALSLDPEFQVRTCASGSEGIVQIAERLPDVILLDVMMPGMDGPETLAKIRHISGAATIPVIFITARAQQSEIQNFAMLDAAGVIAKPFDPLTLADRVREFLP